MGQDTLQAKAMTRRTLTAGLALGAVGLASRGWAQTQPQPLRRIGSPRTAVPTYAIFQQPSTTHILSRRAVRFDAERTYQIFTAVPQKPPGGAGHPVLYMLDGNAAFDRMTPEMLAGAPDLAVIGIGYPTDVLFDMEQRSRDYTPPRPDGLTVDPTRGQRPAGGGARFLELLLGDLRREAETGINVDTHRRTLWGHSFGGLFTLYALFEAPDAFAAYCSISPSTQWGNFALNVSENKERRRTQVRAHVYIALGDSEERGRDNTQTDFTPRPLPSTISLIERLQHRPDLLLQSEVFAGLGHGATAGASWTATLATALAPVS